MVKNNQWPEVMAAVQDLHKSFHTHGEIKQYILVGEKNTPELVEGWGESNSSTLTEEQSSTVAKVLKKNRKLLKLSDDQIQGLMDQINGVEEE